MSSAETNVVKLPESAADRLEQIKAERAKLVAEREKREAEQEVQDKLEREQRGLADERAIAKAEEEHGPLGKKIAAIYTEMGVVIVKRPAQMQFQRFIEAKSGDETAAAVKFVRPNVVHPDKATFDQYYEEQPAMIWRCSNQMLVLAGAKLQEVAGK
jgi:hypothetical protein